MRKFFKIFLLIFLVFIIISIINMSTQKYKVEYDTWFDTRNVFGNGEYQQYDNMEGGLSLINVKYNDLLINSVTNYLEKDEKVYFKGYSWHNVKHYTFEVFVILDLETNIIKYFVVDYPFDSVMIPHYGKMASDNKLNIINSFDEFTEEEKNILNSL